MEFITAPIPYIARFFKKQEKEAVPKTALASVHSGRKYRPHKGFSI
jgi:hypothetical protein